jgi:very-short-patch-repair endonuclease
MGFRTFNPRLKTRARALRAGMTDSEQLLWQRIRRRQILDIQFYRQRPIGPYIVDFYGASIGLVLEVDGSQHQEIAHKEKDRTRDAYLRGRGLYVLRFDSRQVLTETDGVLTVIREVIQERLQSNPPKSPPLKKGG